MKRTLCIASMALCCLLLTACGPKVTGLTMTLAESLPVGDTALAELAANYDKPDATDEDKAKAFEALGVTFTSSDEAIATVDASGKVTAVAGGNVKITATAKDLTASKDIEILVPLMGVEAAKTLELLINKTDSGKVDAKPVPANASVEGTPAYKSSDEKIATVSADGTVKAVANGEAVITTTLDGKTAETKVTVKTGATGIRLEQGAGGTIAVGGSVKLVARTEPVEAEASTYTYVSDNEKIATINGDGVVTGVSIGKANITVKSADGHTAAYTATVAVKCGYCGAFGHNSSNCPVQKAAAAKAAAAKKPSGGTAAGGSAGGGAAAGGGAVAGGGPTPDAGGGGAAPDPAPAPPAEPQHYHGNGNDAGTCPACGLGYSQSVGVGGGAGHDMGDLS